MNEAKILISTQILRDALEFPEDVEIVGREDGNIELTVRSDRVPDDTAEALAVWVRNQDGSVEFKAFEPV